MKLIGRLKTPLIDFDTRRMTLLFESDTDFRLEYDSLKDCEKLSCEIKKYMKKRSLDANAYFHVLVGKIADVIGNSKPAVKNMLLAKYGQYAMDESGVIYMIIRDDIDVSEREEIHLSPTSAVKVLDDGKLYRVYRLIRGSHTYNTAEMSKLIDGTVSEAKDLGIETITSAQIREMAERWGLKMAKRQE